MNKRLLVMTFSILYCCGCSHIKEAQRTYDEVDQQTASIDKAENDKWQHKFKVIESQEDEINLDYHFTGTIYLMAPKETFEMMKKLPVTINQQVLQKLQQPSDDFNIRYHHTMYFTVQQLSVTDVDKLYIQQSSDKIYLLLVDK